MIRAQRPRGILLAGAIGAAWLLSLVGLLSMDLARVPATLLLLGMLVRSLLQTGLFIIGHDAIHGLLLPAHPGVNHRLGALVLRLYAALPYKRCRQNHLQHHRVPGTSEDPDFQASGSSSVIGWYARFLGGYLSTPQMLLLLGAWGLLALATSAVHVLLFCTMPLLISSWQLFAVGTYLPHRASAQGDNEHHAISLDMPEWLSLLACFHFGYHWEHHAYPHLAWYELPGSRRARSRHGYAIRSQSWKPHFQTGRKKSKRWPKPPLPLPTTGLSKG